MIKITGLTRWNVAALREVFPAAIESGDIVVTATTATFTADDSAETVRAAIDRVGRGRHPGHSLWAVVRKLERAAQ